MTMTTTTAGRTTMNTDLLSLTQWLSPSFPLGSFAYSHGLETAITDGVVTDADGLLVWLTDLLEFGTGAIDATLLCLAMAGDDMEATACAMVSSRERFEEANAQGAAFVATVNGMTGTTHAPAPLSVAVGVAARDLSLAPSAVAALYLHSFASNLVSAAVRFVPLGQTEGQKVLMDLHPIIQKVAECAATAKVSDIMSAAFGGDMAAMMHETQEVRIFKT